MTGVNNVTIDRCYIHGSDTQDVVHAVFANQGASYIALIDSQVSDIHGFGSDAQAFLATSSQGPFKLTNNLLSASTEDVMFGGAGVKAPPPYNGYVPSDIEIRNNHFYKPESWIPQTSGQRPFKWVVKNNLECKSCLRLIATDNTFENAWLSGQSGSNVLLTVRTYESGPNAVVNDLDIENNTLLNANVGFSVIGYDALCKPPSCTNQGESARVLIKNNRITLRSPSSAVSYRPTGFSLGHKMRDYLIQDNTVAGMNNSKPFASIYFNQGKCPNLVDQPVNLWIINNVLPSPPTGDCGYTGQKALDSYMPLPAPSNARYTGNKPLAGR
jgi:hypothetical protein